MRIATCTRWLLAAAAAASVVRADETASPRASHESAVGVVIPATESAASNIAVSAMTVTSPINVLLATPSPTPTTAEPTLAPTTADETKPPTTKTNTPTTQPLTPTTTATRPLTPSSPTTGGSAADAGATVGAPITCAFRYSMPAASNLANELSRLAASQKKKNSSPSTSGGSAANSSSSAVDGSSANAGGAAGANNSTPTGTDTAGSAMDETTQPSAGSPDTTMTPATTLVPVPTTKTPTVTSTTKPPTSPTFPSPTTKAPPTTAPSSGSLDGRRLQVVTETGVTPTPTPTTKKPASTTKAPPTATTTAPPTTDGSAAAPSPSASSTASSDSSGSNADSGVAQPTTAPSGSSADSSTTADAAATTAVVTGEFTCDTTFYGAWAQLGLSCDGAPLDVEAAVAQSQCLIYSGVQSSVVDLKLCMSLCKFPKCTNGTWDYAAEDGFSSPVYDKLNFVDLAKYLGKSQLLGGGAASSAVTSVLSSLSLTTERTCSYTSESSFSSCQCENLLVDGSAASTPSKTSPTPAALSPVVDKGLGDANHWGDGVAKTAMDKVSIASAAIGSSAAAVSVAAGAVMSVAGGVMSTGAGVAGGVSATASLGLAMVAVDICQFSVMINQMNLDATPRLLQEMGKRMSPSTFSFLPFGKVEEEPEDGEGPSTNGTVVRRRLMDVTNTNQTLGMERYAALIGVKVDMLFYLTLAGVMMLCVAPFVLCGLFVVVASPFVSDFRAFAGKWFDKTVGVLMMILILSEYVVGVTATFQICYLIKNNNPTDPGMFLAIFSLVFFAVGTILYGIWVVKHHEDDLRDLGTKVHFEKPVHARYGPLYDEYKFEGRYFFAPKLILALLCGVTTGFIGMPGIWQVLVLISLHIAFLLYMEVKRPFPTAFVQKTSSFVIIIKISALFLTLFLISSATSLQNDIPVDLRQGVGFAIIGLQVLVLVCLMVRQMYIFYITWKLKRENDEKLENEAQHGTESFQPLGGDLSSLHHNQNRQQQYNQHQQPNQYNQYNNHAVPIMDGGRASTPLQQYGGGGQQTPKMYSRDGAMRQDGAPKLRGLQPAPLPAQGGMRRTHTVVVHDDPTPNNSYRRHGGNEISL